MNLLHHINDSDTVFTLVTKKLTTAKIHELLALIQEFISQLDEKDLAEDLLKEMTIKKNFQDEGNQTVYLNYRLQSNKPTLMIPEPPNLTSKRYLNEMSQKDQVIFPQSSLPTKKLKMNKSTEPVAFLPSNIPTRNNYPVEDYHSNSYNNFIAESLTVNDEIFLENQNSILFSKLDSRTNFQANDDTRHEQSSKIDFIKNNIIEIEDLSEAEELNRHPSNIESPLNDKQKALLKRLKAHHGVPTPGSDRREKKHSSDHNKSKRSEKISRDYTEDRDKRSRYDNPPSKTHLSSHRRSHDNNLSKSTSRYSVSNIKSYKRLEFSRKSSNSRSRPNRKPKDDFDPPLHLIDAKEDEFVYQYLRKPFTYLKQVEQVTEESNLPVHIEID